MDLYFPEGVPANVERMLNPDVIFKKVRAGLDSLKSDWKKLSPRANDISHGRRPWWKRLFGQTGIDPKWLHHYLYQNPSSWPVSAADDSVPFSAPTPSSDGFRSEQYVAHPGDEGEPSLGR